MMWRHQSKTFSSAEERKYEVWEKLGKGKKKRASRENLHFPLWPPQSRADDVINVWLSRQEKDVKIHFGAPT